MLIDRNKIFQAGTVLICLMSVLCVLSFVILIRDSQGVAREKLRKIPLIAHLVNENDQVKLIWKKESLNISIPDFEDLILLAESSLLTEMPEVSVSKYISYYERVIDYFPNRFPAAYGLVGFCYYQQGRFEEARRAYETAARLDPSFFWAAYNLGVLYYQKDDFKSSAEHFSRGLAISPKRVLLGVKSSFILGQLITSGELDSLVVKSLQLTYGKSLCGLALIAQKTRQQAQFNMIMSNLNKSYPGFVCEEKKLNVQIF